MNNGYNPLRWNCDKGGKGENCFNKKRRPKIQEFSTCFPRKINFGDVDGLVELNGRFCLLEWKGNGGEIQRGQRLSFLAFTRIPGNIVFVVNGNAESMEVQSWGYFWNGRYKPERPGNLEDVKRRLRCWATWAESQGREAA